MASAGGLSLGTLWLEIQARVDDAARVLQDFGKLASDQIDAQKQKWDGLADVGGQFMKVGGALTAAVTVPLVGIGAAAIHSAEQLNVARTGFTTLLGSADAADAMLNDLQKFAATTPFEFPELVQAAQRMKALGFESGDIIPTLRTVGDTAASLGRGKETIDSITLALGQMGARTKVSAQEMNQLTNAGVNGWQALADGLHKSVKQTQEEAEKGLISATTAIPLILEGMRKQAGGSMDAMSKTLTGQFSNLKDQIGFALIPIGQQLIPALQALIPVLIDVVGEVVKLANWFATLPAPFRAGAIALAGFAAAMGPALVALGAMFSAIGTLMPGLTSIATFFGTSVVGLIPWALGIAAVVAALVALGTWVYSNWDQIGPVFVAGWKAVVDATKPVVDWFKSLYTDGLLPLANAAAEVWSAIQPLAGAIARLYVAAIVIEWEAFVAILKFGWDIVSGFVGFLAGLAAQRFKEFAADVKSMADSFMKFWGPSIKWAAEKLKEFLGWLEEIPGIGPHIKKAVAGFDKLADSIKDMDLAGAAKGLANAAKGATGLGTATKKAAAETDDATKKEDKLQKALEKSQKVYNEMLDIYKRTGEGLDGVVAAQADVDKAQAALDARFLKSHPTWAKTSDAIRDAQKAHLELVPLVSETTSKYTGLDTALSAFAFTTLFRALPLVNDTSGATRALDLALANAHDPAVELATAMDLLGITSVASMEKTAFYAVDAFNTIAGSGLASATQVREAHVKALQATGDAYIAAGQSIPAADQIMLAKLESQQANYMNNSVNGWRTLFQSINASFQDIFASLNASIVTGDWASFRDAIIKDLQNIGIAAVDKFLKPLEDGLSTLMSGAIAKVLGAAGLGGLSDALEKLGEKLGGVLGTNKTPAGTTPPYFPGTQIPMPSPNPTFPPAPGTTAPPAGGACCKDTVGAIADVAKGAGEIAKGVGQTAAAVAGGVVKGAMAALNPISAVADVVTAVASVAALFGVGQGGQLDRLNRISDATGYMAWAVDTGGMRIALLDMKHILEAFIAPNIEAARYAAEEVAYYARLADTRGAAAEASNARFHAQLDQLNATGKEFNMKLFGTDPATVAAYLATQLRLQGASA